MQEKELKEKVQKELKKRFPGGWLWKISDQWRSGVPDILFIWHGVNIFFELKTEKGVVSKIQEYTIRKINAAGGNAYVCRSVDEVILKVIEVAEKKGLYEIEENKRSSEPVVCKT